MTQELSHRVHKIKWGLVLSTILELLKFYCYPAQLLNFLDGINIFAPQKLFHLDNSSLSSRILEHFLIGLYKIKFIFELVLIEFNSKCFYALLTFLGV